MEVPINSAASIIMALAALVTAIGSLQVVLYRIKQLELKMEKHNNFMARVAVLETDRTTCYHKLEDVGNKVDSIIKGEYK